MAREAYGWYVNNVVSHKRPSTQLLDSVSQSPWIDWSQVGRVIPLSAVDLDRHEITRLDQPDPAQPPRRQSTSSPPARLGRFAAGIHVIDFRSRHDVLLCYSPRVTSTCSLTPLPGPLAVTLTRGRIFPSLYVRSSHIAHWNTRSCFLPVSDSSALPLPQTGTSFVFD